MKNPSTELFKQLPDRIFTPLASTNRQRYWSVLCAIYKHKFGPDAPIPPTYGYLISDIHRFIENYITYDDVWEDEDDNSSETPLNIRAVSIFNRLSDAGWFVVEKHIMDKVVTMRPSVGQFLSTLVNFAEKGPVFVSGKIRSIANLIEQVQSGQASGDSLREAAEQSRNLIQHIQNTSMNVRELIDSLNPLVSTSQYVRSFFQDYIQQYFIGDYKDLKTQDHPLTKRRQVIDATELISSNTKQRTALIAWYSQYLTKGNDDEAAHLLEMDFSRVFALEGIEDFLNRLDDELRRANRKALAVINYKVRSTRPLDDLIHLAIKNMTNFNGTDVETPFASQMLMSGARLYEPKVNVEKLKPEPLRKKTVSFREIAIARLMQKARDARSVSAIKLTKYVDANLVEKQVATNDVLSIKSIEDLRAYQTLQVVSMAQSASSYELKRESRMMARTFDVNRSGTNEIGHPFISGKPFIVKHRQGSSTTNKNGGKNE